MQFLVMWLVIYQFQWEQVAFFAAERRSQSEHFASLLVVCQGPSGLDPFIALAVKIYEGLSSENPHVSRWQAKNVVGLRHWSRSQLDLEAKLL